MKAYRILPGVLFIFLLLQACSENEDSVKPDLNGMAFSADAHVRTSTLPQNILDYITDNYPGLTIIEAEIEDNQNYEIELSDGTELIFNSQGEFLGVDNDENEFGDEDIAPSELPQNILDFISDNYPGVDIEEAELENNGNYEVELENDVELIFDGDGNFLGQAQDENDDDQGEDEEDIDPAELPQTILDYIAENYPDNTIIEAEREDEGYEVTLNNGVELKFDQEGNFLSQEDGNGDDDDEDEEDD
ncbi:PepSY-like domain-containing protein [Gramella jeungdoensis]|nr:PepSY-like domain-containing protein [Gramella jeungdoensis]